MVFMDEILWLALKIVLEISVAQMISMYVHYFIALFCSGCRRSRPFLCNNHFMVTRSYCSCNYVYLQAFVD